MPTRCSLIDMATSFFHVQLSCLVDNGHTPDDTHTGSCFFSASCQNLASRQDTNASCCIKVAEHLDDRACAQTAWGLIKQIMHSSQACKKSGNLKVQIQVRTCLVSVIC